MRSDERKAAVAAYKKRRNAAGIFAIRCGGSGQAWVGQTLTLDTIENRIWFSLRMGSHGNVGLQSAWATYGAEAFTFEPLETLAEEELPYVRDRLLGERAVHWRSKLNGSAV